MPHYNLPHNHGQNIERVLDNMPSAEGLLYMLEDRLTEHLNAVDDEAQERMGILVRQMMDRQGITEELKVRDQMEWVRAVNGIRIIMQYMLMRTLKFIRGQQKKSIIISNRNYPNILFPGTLQKNLRILQDCIWPFLQQSCYHFYLFRIHEKVPMNYYIQSLLRQSNIYVGK